MRPLADYLQGFTDRALPVGWLHCGGRGGSRVPAGDDAAGGTMSGRCQPLTF
jgi:hypothetical protein